MHDQSNKPVGQRAKAKATVRHRIVEAAMGLFSDEGYDAVSTVRIAEGADVTQRTLFRYFPRKDLIVYAAVDEVVAFEEALTQALADGSPSDQAILKALSATAAYCENHRDDMRTFAALLRDSASLRSAEFDRQLRLEWLCALALQGPDSFRARRMEPNAEPGLRYRMMAGSVMGIIRPVVREWQAGARYSLVTAISVTAGTIASLIMHANACYEDLPTA